RTGEIVGIHRFASDQRARSAGLAPARCRCIRARLPSRRHRGVRLGPQDVARMRPGIVYVSLCAYAHEGPWASRRGFDSLVQTASGFNAAEAEASGASEPRPLPAQVLDHATGYLMAFAAMSALARRAQRGGSWHVRLSLAQTGYWLRRLGRIDGLACPDPGFDDVR